MTRRIALLVSFVVACVAAGATWHYEPLWWISLLFGAWALMVLPALVRAWAPMVMLMWGRR